MSDAAISTSNLEEPLAGDGGYEMPRHVAIIMDGNGRWAAARVPPMTGSLRFESNMRALADLEPHDRGIETLIADHRQQVLLVEHQRLCVLVGAVEDGGDLAGVTQAAARTLAMRRAEVRAEGE